MISLFRKVVLWLALLWVAALAVCSGFDTTVSATGTTPAAPTAGVGSPAHPSSLGFD